jgi:hypothetical protein
MPLWHGMTCCEESERNISSCEERDPSLALRVTLKSVLLLNGQDDFEIGSR